MLNLPSSMRLTDADRTLHLDPHDDAFVQDPYAVYAHLHRNAPRFFWQDYDMWCFAGYDDVNRLFRDKRLGRAVPESRKKHGGRDHLSGFDAIERHSLLELEPPDHTRLRALVNRAFVSRTIENLRPEIEIFAHGLIDGFEADGASDLIPAFATPIPVAIITRMMGLPVDAAAQLLDWSHTMVAMYMHGRTRETEEKAGRAAKDFAGFVREAVALFRAGKAQDDSLLAALVAAHDNEKKLSEDELVSSVILLLNAGHEATVHQAGNAIRTLLLQDGDLRVHFKTSEDASVTVEELIRIDPPLHMFTRFAYEDIDLGGGLIIEKDSEIGLMLGAANHDPAAFADPYIFNPERPRKQNLSFGAGIHFCIGAPLARLELQVALRALFDRLPGLRLSGMPRYRDSYHFHGLERLDCQWR